MRRILAAILCTALLAGCGGAATENQAKPKQTIVMDVIPTQMSDKFRVQMDQLGKLLSNETGLDIQVRIPTDYATVVEAMRFGKSDVAYFGPFTYVVANAQSGAQAFVTMNVKGKPYYHSYGIVLKDSPISTFTDKDVNATLKGKTVALGDHASTSSSQIPQLVFQSAGLDKEKDLNLVFTGAHDAVLKAVVAGKADIGFLDSAIFEGSLANKFPADFAKVKIVYTSVELYQYPWAHRKDLDPAIVKQLQDAFLKITDKEALEAFGADAFIATDDSKYAPVRDAAKALGIDLGKYEMKKK